LNRVSAPLLAGAAGAAIARILGRALAAVEPASAVEAALARTDLLQCRPSSIVLVAIGKAAVAMAQALVDGLGDRVRTGIVVAKANVPAAVGRLTALRGEHPVPGPGSVRAGAAVLDTVSAVHPDDTVVVAISGGASALVSTPEPPLSHADLATTTAALLRSGVDIDSLNAVRKHLEVLKGGGLATRVAPARTVSFVLSDVVGDALTTIASGPTAADATTWDDVATALAACRDPIPPAVAALVAEGRAGRRPETPGPGDPRLARVEHHIVASNATAIDAAVQQARAERLTVQTGPSLVGEAREVGRDLGQRIAAADDTPRAIVLGGETTVTVVGDGRGGRNQELALAASLALAGTSGRHVAALATDGEDGPTDAAGGVVDGGLVARAEDLGLDVREHLRRNDAMPLLEATGGLLRTGPTGTNVCDLVLGIVWPSCLPPTRAPSCS